MLEILQRDLALCGVVFVLRCPSNFCFKSKYTHFMEEVL